MVRRPGRLLAAALLLAVAVPAAAATTAPSLGPSPRATAIAPAIPADTTPLALSSTRSHDPDQQAPQPAETPSPEGAPSPTATASPTSDDIETPPARDADSVESPRDNTPSIDASDVIEEAVDDVKETVDDVIDLVTTDVDLSKVEARLLKLVNAERQAAGLREYNVAGDLVRIARDWSEVMASTGSFHHNPSLAAQMCCYSKWGENVAWGGVPEGWLMESTDGIHRNLMRSATHRANILDPKFDQVGIGAVVSNGKLWVTQVFRRHAG